MIRNWSEAQRRSLWPICVAEMEDFERRLGGPVTPGDAPASDPDAAALGMLTPAQNCVAAVAAVERWVLPALIRIGIVNRVDRARQ